MSASNTSTERRPTGEPAWDIAKLFPEQGAWTEEDYLAFNDNRFIEFSDGNVEVLSMPTTSHQMIAFFLAGLLNTFAGCRQLGLTLMAPLRVRLWPGKYREPDVVFMLAEHSNRIGEQFWTGADLVMEVISPDDRRRDLEIKRREYRMAGILEYWIVDPESNTITVLTLDGEQYVEHGVFVPGEKATSRLLAGFEADVTAVFAAATSVPAK